MGESESRTTDSAGGVASGLAIVSAAGGNADAISTGLIVESSIAGEG